MKKKDSNPVDKKKKQGNPQKEKLEEKPKDKKNIPKVLSLEKSKNQRDILINKEQWQREIIPKVTKKEKQERS